MSICIEKLPHECGTRQGLQVFADEDTGKVSGYCFACCTYVADPYGEPKTLTDIPQRDTSEDEERVEEIGSYPTVDVAFRKLRAKHLDLFGVKVSVSESDGETPTALYFPMYVGGRLTGYYAKTLASPSVSWAIGDVRKAEPFGWRRARKTGAYRLIITEGREDAVAVESILDRYGKKEYHPAVISLPNGTNSVKSSLIPLSQEINRSFKEVVICFDDDDAGHKATKEAMLIFPQATSVILPENDANECIMKGAMKAAYKALAFHNEKPKNTSIIISSQELHEAARAPATYGEFTWPFPSMNSLMRGMRTGETIYVGAGVKMGKSEVVDTLGAHLIKEHDVPVFMAKPEQETKKTYKKILGKIVGRQFDDPDVPFDDEAFDEAGKVVGNKLHLIDLYQHMGWETLKNDIMTSVSYGARAVFIDPITNLTAGMPSAQANEFLTGVTRDLSAMAMDMNIVVFLFCHLKAPDGSIAEDKRDRYYREKRYHQLGSCPHERGGTVFSSQFSGSRAMMQSCNLMLALEGNKDDKLEEQVRNMRWLTILEDREFGNVASIPLYWNRNTTQFKELNQ